MVVLSLRLEPGSVVWVRSADVWTSYAAGIPAFLVTTWGLVLQSRAFRRQGMPQLSREMTGAAIAFLWYAVFDSMFVPKIPYFPASLLNANLFIDIVGIPIQIFRAATALVIAFFFIRALRLFAAEDRRRLS